MVQASEFELEKVGYYFLREHRQIIVVFCFLRYIVHT
jgi:hypothetical protein